MATVQKRSARRILPGGTIGILGSGQLGRMVALAARNLGYRIAIYSPEADSPAAAVADVECIGAYEDLAAIRKFAASVDVVTFEFENVPSATTRAAAEFAPVRPDGQVLHVTQHRLREKSFLSKNGFPVTPFRRIQSLAALQKAAQELGLPAVLKTASFGYDGKGQVKLKTEADLVPAWESMKGAEAIYEAWVNFEKEISVVAARTLDGQFAAFPVFENRHAHHILDVTFAPADISPRLRQEAVALAEGILKKLGVVGVLTVELFVTKAGKILVNELAPRVHNSGHLTMDACVTSQFEQQVRAVCGLPLGDASLRAPAAMSNLLGHLWEKGEPAWGHALQDGAVKLHLYGKRAARVGRKMGHINATGKTAAAAIKTVTSARNRLTAGSRS